MIYKGFFPCANNKIAEPREFPKDAPEAPSHFWNIVEMLDEEKSILVLQQVLVHVNN